MRQTLKQFIKLTAGYSLVTLLGPLLTIFLTPLYTRVLEPADYGIVDVALTLSSFITIFAILGINQALNAHFFDGDFTYKCNLITSAIIFVSVAGFILGIVVTVTAVPLAEFLYKNTKYSYLFYILAVNAITVPIYSIAGSVLRLQMNIKLVNILGLTYLFVTVAGNILFVLVMQLGATGIILANMLTNFISGILGLFLTLHVFRGSFEYRLLKPLVQTGITLIPGHISNILLVSIDRLILTQFVSQTDIGLYAIANKLGSMMYVLSGATWSAWWPIALEMAYKPDAPRQYARMFEYFVAISMVISLTIGLFTPEILMFFTRSVYIPAAPYALVLLVYFGPISSVFSSFQIGLYISKKTYLISMLIFIGAITNIILNLLLDPVIGIWGAVWATLLAGIIMSTIAYFVSRQVLFIPYHIPRFLVLTVVYLSLISLFLCAPDFNILLLKAGAIILFICVILLTGIISYKQIFIGLQSVQYHFSRSMRLK